MDYSKLLAEAVTPEQKEAIYKQLGISNQARYGDYKSYLGQKQKSDFELLNQIPLGLRAYANSFPTRQQLINYVESMNESNESNKSTKSSNKSTKSSNIEYQNCLTDARKRKAENKLKLCPEGYCTAKLTFEVYPSAYANGYASQVCKGTKPDLEGKTENHYEGTEKSEDSDLNRWFQEKWVNVCEPGYPPCGRSKAKMDSKNYPYCRPLNKLPGTKVKTVNELTPSELKQMCALKQSLPQGVDNESTRVYLSELPTK